MPKPTDDAATVALHEHTAEMCAQAAEIAAILATKLQAPRLQTSAPTDVGRLCDAAGTLSSRLSDQLDEVAVCLRAGVPEDGHPTPGAITELERERDEIEVIRHKLGKVSERMVGIDDNPYWLVDLAWAILGEAVTTIDGGYGAVSPHRRALLDVVDDVRLGHVDETSNDHLRACLALLSGKAKW